MRVFSVVLLVCVVEGAALGVLLADRASPPVALAAVAISPRASHPPPPRSLTLVAGGDVSLAGEPQSALFAGTRAYLRPADLAVANLEGTLATGGGARGTPSAKRGWFVFCAAPPRAPPPEAAGLTPLRAAHQQALRF